MAIPASATAAAGDPVTIMAGCGASLSADRAWVTAVYPDGSTWSSNRACPKGDKDSFNVQINHAA